MGNITDLSSLAALLPKIDGLVATDRPLIPALVPDNPARWMHERVVRSINEFEATLDPNQEVGARLVAFGSERFTIEDVGYWGPDIIVFHGRDAKSQPVQLLQHISQLSVLLVAMKAKKTPGRRIGFGLVEKLETNAERAP